jgi:outer membrane receptor for Fe3+-dicitrate
MIGPSAHEVGVGYRYVNESTHEMRYYTATTSGELPSTASPYDRDTRSGTEAHAWYIDDRVDIGNWTITPGMRFEHIESYQDNNLLGTRERVSYNAPLPALNVLYHLTDSWNLYANTEGSFGTVQYSQIGKAVQSGNVEPEKARTWEVGTRYDDGALTAEMGLFLINFNNQYDSNQTNDTVTARGKTRHSGLEAQTRYALGELSPALDNLSSTPAMRTSMLKSARKAIPTVTRFPSRRSTKAPLASITSPAAGRLTSTATSSRASLPITPIPLPKAPMAAPAAFPAICCGALAWPMTLARRWPISTSRWG